MPMITLEALLTTTAITLSASVSDIDSEEHRLNNSYYPYFYGYTPSDDTIKPKSIELLEKFAQYRETVGEFANYENNWDTFNSPPPSSIAISNTEYALTVLEKNNLLPDRVVPSSDDSIMIDLYFKDQYRYVLLEFFNDGDIAVLDKRGDVTEVQDLSKQTLKEFIQSL